MSAINPEMNVNKVPLAHQLHDPNQSAIKRYRKKAAGDIPLGRFIWYELVSILVGNLGGGLGYLLRQRGYTPLFQSMGAGVILGKGIGIRHPHRIRIGSHVSIDDHVLLDASGSGDTGIRIEDRAIISRNSVVQGKTGPVMIGEESDIGANTIITSVSGIHLEKSVLIAGNCYIGGARYHREASHIPVMEQGAYSRGRIVIGQGSWLGAGVIVLDGVSIGKGCVVGAGSVVTTSLPDHCVAAGVPARIIRGSGQLKRPVESDDLA